jgi:VCBS repeat-containing protein
MATIIGTGGNDTLKGTNGDDVIFGGSGNDNINGGKGDDVLDGGDGDDILIGGDGGDILIGGRGNDFLQGGQGIDTAVFSASILEYSFWRTGGNLFVSHNGPGGAGTGHDGTDRLLHIERLQFADALIDLTANNAPIAFADFASLTEDDLVYSSGSASVLANDFDWEGSPLTAAAGSFTGTWGTLHLNANGTYTYVLKPAAQTLALGQNVTDVFTYTVSDGSLSSTGTLTFTIAGLNDAPVAAPDTATTDENAAVLIDVLANDTDVDNGAVLTVIAASVPKGSVAIVGNKISFDPGTAFDHLALGASEVVTISYTITDEHGATSSSTVAVTVTGSNDAPVAVPDTAAGHENEVLTIDVLANDTDVDDGAVLTIVAASVPKGSVAIVGGTLVFDPGTAFDHLALGASEVVTIAYTISDEHGATASSTVTVTVTGTNDAPVAVADTATAGENEIVVIDALANDFDVDDGAVLAIVAASVPAGQGSVAIVDGKLVFDPGADFDYLAVGESASVSIAYTISDEHGATSSATVSLTVTGANDAPVILVGQSVVTGAVTELVDQDPAENAFTHIASGSIAFADPDLSDTHSASFAPQGAGYLGTFALGPVDQNGNTVGWTFSVEDADIDFLAEGETLTQVYTIQISDGNGGTVTQDVTVTITGRSDNVAPVANDDAYAAIGNVVLTVSAAQGVLANDEEFGTGTIGTGPGGTPVTAYDAVSANGGTVTMNPDGSFTYVSAPGFQGVDSFTYTITDPEGESSTATVTVTVTGSVWFIDNAAAASLNLGTQDNPYTSLAAFNAAQGTANGPQPGETVYLRAGTGTYAEGDGINLLNGQTLIGGGQDLVVNGTTIETAGGRPTIATTGAGNHGVELAQNNTVYGLDIGDTTGAGISDGNGSVGSLTIFDVNISGVGQIIDIDQGGTLNVSLGNIASAASSGGAIDLNGVAGSFTVTGTTVIAGVHSGGGVDITASSLTATFAGGGLVMTGAATAVNFSGNSGSLVISGGNFDIATTSGTSLLVQNGGSVSISGAGNNIASTTGSAVIIRNAASNGVTLESVSASGGSANGIILDNAGSGGFTVTGIDSIQGSGGTISGKNGPDGSATQGTGVYIANTGNVSLANMQILANANNGIFGSDVNGFTLRDSTVSGNGSTLGEASVSFVNLTGTALLEGNVIELGRGDNLRIVNNGGALDLTIRDSADDAAVIGLTHASGLDGIFIETSGSATLDLAIEGVEFLGARSDLLSVLANGNSVQTIRLDGNIFHNDHPNIAPGGGGVALGGGSSGASITVDYIVTNNSFRGADGNAFSAYYVSSGAAIRGYVADNVIGIGDSVAGSSGSSGGGNGLFIGIEKLAGAGSAIHQVNIVGNEIYDLAFATAGIVLAASGGGAGNGAVLEAALTGNIVTELGDFAFAALYAAVGASALSGDHARLGLDLTDNLFDAGGAFGGNAIYLDQVSEDAAFYFPGYSGSPDGEYFGGTASEDLSALFVSKGNVLVDGAFAAFPGGVDAGIITGATGLPFLDPPWVP